MNCKQKEAIDNLREKIDMIVDAMDEDDVVLARAYADLLAFYARELHEAIKDGRL